MIAGRFRFTDRTLRRQHGNKDYVSLRSIGQNDHRSRQRTVAALFVAAGILACDKEPNGPTTLGPPTPLQDAIAQRFQEQFGETLSRPAVFVPTVDSSRACEWHVTSTAWVKPSGPKATLLTLYTSPDGRTVAKGESAPYLRPAGNFRVLVALVRHPNVGDGGLALWEAAQRQMNTDHESFARSKGFPTPIVTFTNTNVVLEPDDARGVYSRAGIVAVLASRGYIESAYDVIVSVNINPAITEGGFSLPGQGFIYMGNFGFKQPLLSASAFVSIARAVYGHEFAHLWGWPGTHDWAACHTGTFPSNFWVPPVLLGWEDVDGDRIPEIKDPDPYGRPQR